MLAVACTMDCKSNFKSFWSMAHVIAKHNLAYYTANDWYSIVTGYNMHICNKWFEIIIASLDLKHVMEQLNGMV